MTSSFILRIRILSAFIFLFASLLITKLVSVQILNHEDYSDRADRQYTTPSGDIFERGDIYFKGKDGSLIGAATTVSGFKAAVNPKEIKDPEKIYDALKNIIPIDRESFMAKTAKKDDPYEEVANKLSREEADKVSALYLPGVSVYKEKWRSYPGSELAAQTLGFLGYQGDELAGRYGLERHYDDILSRKDDDLYINFFAEIFGDLNRSLFAKEKSADGDVIISIDPTVQGFLEKALGEIVSDWRSDAVGGIILNPKDGSIYALAHLPTYDPNNVQKSGDISIFSNPIVQNVYEFGSVVKALTMAAGLDSGAVRADTTYEDKGFIVLNNRQINNYDHKARGFVSMQEVLNQSLNTGSVFVMQKIGRERFKNYMLSYGLGEKTGIDLPSEASGLVNNFKSSVAVDYATTSFGQGVAFTPIEAAVAFSALGNGGRLITPHLATEIKYESGASKKIEYAPGRQVISKEASEEITRMLVEVVDRALLGGEVKMEHYSVAAKTGTAQMSKGEGGGYYDDRYLHSFFGYFPAYDPKFLIFLYNIYPKGAKYASATLTYPFSDLAKFLINYYNVPPDR